MYSCENCSKEFKTKKGMIYHVKNKICMKKKHQCEHCNVKFSKINSYYRHRKNYCKVVKIQDNMNDLMEKFKELEKKNEEKDKELEKIKEQLKDPKVQNIINNNNNNININVNAFGNECVHFDEEEWKKMAHFEIIQVMVEKTHLKNKENHNFYIFDDKSNKALYYDGKDWKYGMKNALIDELFNRQIERISDGIFDYTEVPTNDRYGTLSNKLKFLKNHVTTEEGEKQNKTNLYLLFLNNRKKIQAIYEQTS